MAIRLKDGKIVTKGGKLATSCFNWCSGLVHEPTTTTARVTTTGIVGLTGYGCTTIARYWDTDHMPTGQNGVFVIPVTKSTTTSGSPCAHGVLLNQPGSGLAWTCDNREGADLSYHVTVWDIYVDIYLFNGTLGAYAVSQVGLSYRGNIHKQDVGIVGQFSAGIYGVLLPQDAWNTGVGAQCAGYVQSWGYLSNLMYFNCESATCLLEWI